MKQQVWILFFLAAPLCSSDQDYNEVVNGNVTLSPVGISNVNRVVWKFGVHMVADSNPYNIYGNYKERTSLDNETGKIIISKLTLNDSGMFSVEVNSNETLDAYRLKVFEAVDTVEITRDDSSNSLCALLCIAKPSSGEGSLNYVWIENGQFFSTGSNLTVNNSDLSHSYTCNASNPVTWKSTTRKAEDICRVNNVDISKGDSSNSSCTLLCKAKPEGSLNYEWTRSEQFLSTGSLLTVNNSDLSHSYTCNASNPVSWKITTEKAEDICKGDGKTDDTAGNGIPWQRFFALVLGSVGIIGIGAVGWRLYQNRDGKTDDTAGNDSQADSNRDTDDQNGESGGLMGKSTV